MVHSSPAIASVPPSPDLPALAYLIEQSIGYLLRRTTLLLSNEVERAMEPLGLTEAQWKPMLRLYLASEGVNVATLARNCMLDAGAMTRTLDRLEAKQLCRRVRSQEDRRVVQLELTPEGRAAAVQVPEVLTRVQGSALDGFQPEEVDTLRGLLQRLLTNLDAMASAQTDGSAVPAAPVSHNHSNKTSAP